MAEHQDEGGLSQTVADTIETVERARLDLPFSDADWRDQQRRDLAKSLQRYLLPRLTDDDAPVVAIIVGLSGTGRSTIVNALAGRRVSPTGTIRPTTTTPVIWAHRRHAGRYWAEFMERARQQVDPEFELVLADDPLTHHLTLVDAPAPDTFEDGPERLSDMLSMADLCIVVAAAARYADAESWDLMRLARRRGVPILHVLNRVEQEEVAADYAAKLADQSLLSRPDPRLLFTVPELTIDPATGGVPAPAVGQIERELAELADPAFRDRLRDLSVETLRQQLAFRAVAVADLGATQLAVVNELASLVSAAYGRQGERFAAELSDGLGAGDLTSVVRSLVGRSGFAAQEAATAWSQHEVGKRLLDGDGAELWRPAPDVRMVAQQAVERWRSELSRLVTEHGRLSWVWRLRRAGLAEDAQLAVLGLGDGARLRAALGPDGAQDLVADGRAALLEAMRTVFDHDAGRFRAALGPHEAVESMVGALTSAADALVAT